MKKIIFTLLLILVPVVGFALDPRATYVNYQNEDGKWVFSACDELVYKVNEFNCGFSPLEGADGIYGELVNCQNEIVECNNESYIFIPETYGKPINVNRNKKGLILDKTYADGLTCKYKYKKNLLQTIDYSDGLQIHFERDENGDCIHQYSTRPDIPDVFDEVWTRFDKNHHPMKQWNKDGSAIYFEYHKNSNDYWTATVKKNINPGTADFNLVNTFQPGDDDNQIPFIENGEKIEYQLIENADESLILVNGNNSEAYKIIENAFVEKGELEQQRFRYSDFDGYRNGNFIIFGKNVYWKTLNQDSKIDLISSMPAEALYEQEEFRGEIYNIYVVPDGLLVSYRDNKDEHNYCGFKIEDGAVTKSFGVFDTLRWLKETDPKNKYEIKNYYRIYKNNVDMNNSNKIGDDHDHCDFYLGTLWNTYEVFKFYDYLYLFNPEGNLECSVYLPWCSDMKNKKENARDCAAALRGNGKIVCMVYPEIEVTKRIDYEDDYYIEYGVKEGSSAELYEAVIPDFGKINQDNVKFMTLPTENSNTVQEVKKGDIVHILERTKTEESIKGKTGVWCKVRLTNKKIGYVFSADVDIL